MAYTFKHGDRPVEGYTIQRAVGRGGFGEVYYAISDGGREVAIKYLRDNPQIELRGVSHCINLKSPHLVAIFDVRKTSEGEFAIIMEYCSGPSLQDLLIAEPNGFTPQKAAFFVREMAKGLAYLHDRGIVHRDLKPGNIFYDDGYVKIGDYGLSKFISVSRHSVQTASVGTVHYMAPEIGSGNYSRGIDIYALGVMLYEMLLGKVPFEGSTMAEVLMKHLTTQPELENLPQPIAQVIRKALAKDPKDRYQTVDDMITEILDVDEVRDSLAGFHPRSLEGAVRGGAGERNDSPMPSPNPVPNFAAGLGQAQAEQPGQPPFAIPVEELNAMSGRAAKRMKRIERKFEAKMAKLEGRRARPKKARHTPRPNEPVPGTPSGVEPTGRKKRILLSGLMSVGLAVGLGILVGNTACGFHEEWGGAAGMLVIAMASAVLLSRGAINWFGVAYGPTWSMRMIQLCFATPLLAIGASPLLSSGGSVWSAGMAIWLGLGLVTVMCNWERTLENAAGGEMKFSTAIWRALCALIVVAIGGEIFEASGQMQEQAMLVAAGVAGAATLILQATAWWLPGKADRALERLGPPRNHDDPGRPGYPPAAPPVGDEPHERAAVVAHATPPVQRISDAEGMGASRHPRERWGITRAFWGLIAFALMGGTITTFLFSLIAREIPYHDRTSILLGLMGCVSGMLFALRKTTPLSRPGFWRESLRPLLMSALLFGIGGTITGIAREWDHYEEYVPRVSHVQRASVFSNPDTGERTIAVAPEVPLIRVSCIGDDERVGLVTGLVMSSLGLIGLTLFTGRKPRPPQPFLREQDSGVLADGYGVGSDEHADLDDAEATSAKREVI